MVKKRPKQNKTALGAAFGVVFGIILGAAFDNVGLGIALGIALGAGAASTMQKMGAKKNQISDDVAEAMVNKMKFDAEQHRKKRDRYNYIKMTGEEEE
jgi:uncharacterized membrane protein